MKKNITLIVSNFAKEIDNNIDLFNNPSIDSGSMGIAIFYLYCYRAFKNEVYLKKGEKMIEKSIEILSEISKKERFSPTYRLDSIQNSIASFGKGLLFIKNKLKLDYDFSSYLIQITETLETLNDETIIDNDYDISSGKLSIAYFFLNQYIYNKDTRSKLILIKIYECIKRDAKYDDNKNIYWTSPKLNNVVYLGISHGSAMIINFITKLHKYNIITKVEIPFLEKAVNFIYSKKRDFVDGYFPSTLSEKVIGKSQLGLCYGDLGVIFALSKANEIIKNNIAEQVISSMLRTTEERTMDTYYTFDAGIIYGASGVFSVFKTFFTRNKCSQRTLDYWYKEIINCLKNDNIFYFKKEDSKPDPFYRYSFGWGIAGIGIILLIGNNNDLPAIDELLFTGIDV